MEAPNGLVGDRYRFVRLLGRGGMGAVWEGWDERLRRSVALKVFHAQDQLPAAEAEQLTERAMREARVVARLQHRHAISIYDVVEYEGRPCLVMEFVPSETLAQILGELTTLLEHEAATLGAQVASALAAAHAAGIIHRDVKPANILIDYDGTARISDFGIAHAFGETTLTSAGMLTGTPAYLAPEVARGEDSSYASDVFSLGSTLYAALEGRPPFGDQRNPIGLLHRVASGQITPPEHAGALTPLLTEMLSPDPRDRPTMAQVADDLYRFRAADRRPVAVPAVPPPAGAGSTDAFVLGTPGTEGDSPSRRRRTLVAAVLLVAAALVVAVVVLLRPGTSDPAAGPQPSSSSTSAASTTTSTAASTAASTAEETPTGTAAVTEEAAPSPVGPTASTPAGASVAPSVSAPPRPPSALPTPVAVSQPPTGQQLAAAISSYYTLVPRNLDQAWPLMTADYQTRHAGGRAAYDRFWGGFSAVSATQVAGSSPSTATALITYTRLDGTVVRERTTFGLVNEGGVLKIASSTVMSSSG